MTATFLEKIIAHKREELASIKEKLNHFPERTRRKYSLQKQFENLENVLLISEVKKASPSKGLINDTIVPKEQAVIYEKSGANAISVLTDEVFFKGSIYDLHEVTQSVTCPVLCKDFIIDPIQIDLAERAGADIILLIVAALDEKQLFDLYRYAKDKNLDVIVEVHNSEELQRAIKIKAPIIGINNRNLHTFEVDLATTENLIEEAKQFESIHFISESGIRSRSDVESVVAAGATGILVGETLMRSTEVAETIKELRIPVTKGFVRK